MAWVKAHAIFLILAVHSLLVILVIRGGLLPEYLVDLHVLFCLDPRDPRDSWRFHFRCISWIYTYCSA